MLQTNLLNPGHADLVTRKLSGALYLMELTSRRRVRFLRREVYVPTLLDLDITHNSGYMFSRSEDQAISQERRRYMGTRG